MSSLIALARSPTLLALFFVLLMAQFGVRTVQPIITLYVQEMVGNLPNVATLAGIAFSISGVANVIAAPFLGTRSDRLGYRRVLLICLAGAALTTLPQAFAGNYYVFTAERFAVGLFIGGLLPVANAMVARLVDRSERGAVFGMTSSAMFLGNSLGPLIGGVIAAGFGLRWVFLMTALVMAAEPRLGLLQGAGILRARASKGMNTIWAQAAEIVVFTGGALSRESGFAPFDPATMPPGCVSRMS